MTLSAILKKLPRVRWYTLLALPILAIPIIYLVHNTRFTFKKHFRGLYLLRGTGGYLFEVKNDLFLNEGKRIRLITGFNLEDPRYRLMHKDFPHVPGRPYLEYVWDEDNGSGYVRNRFPDGKEISTIFSRFAGDNDMPTHGLFVGGALPQSLEDMDPISRNNTGMAYYDGSRWYHLWCVSNEGLASAGTSALIPPSEWKYLGSRVERVSGTGIEITSSHEAKVDTLPLRIERTALFRAGDNYFTLSIKFTNLGEMPVRFLYCYGDEPWLGDYGDSRGNVGWVKGRIVNTEAFIDPARYDYIGMFDYGNPLIGEDHNHSMVADFLQWMGEVRPRVAYFSNSPVAPPSPSAKDPLMSSTRFVGVQWGPITLAPGRTTEIKLAVGMAPYDPKINMPVKPSVDTDYEPEFAQNNR